MFSKLFTKYITPKLQYVVPLWSPHLQKHVDLLENIQRKVTIFLPYINEQRYTERSAVMGLPTLEVRRTRRDVIIALSSSMDMTIPT